MLFTMNGGGFTMRFFYVSQMMISGSHKSFKFSFRVFRVIPAESYLNEFASDRRHMRRPDDSWIKPPPPYPPIATSSELK